ncbi:hypothetical protein A2Y83_01310 [Candidatus Falkowbacteria bacterium RBG_13_39_14]|uniref:SIMPL domain-containing protein n=1 Tax=Candidatus Falkowbacteria bacterium RBG_13_39_14 TaxID=1797985 RepID=A0A1F5S4J0_9BACT|nr:MAG: hypothetical protein A2Y83_01310 [Candidatus Falkowbacteria bacterium RBG_13_39_14]
MDEKKQFEISNRLYVLVGILLAAIVFFMAMRIIADFSALPENFPREITVTAEGKVFTAPDIATVKIGVKSEGKEISAAVSDNNKKLKEALESIRGLGIEEKDIKTAKYDLYPRYDYKEGERIFKGYELNQEIIVKIRDFEKIGSVIGASAEKGANLIGDLAFAVDDPEGAKEEAIKKAIEKAKAKAEFIAQESGFELVKVINFFEESSEFPEFIGRGGEKAIAGEAPIIQPGESEIAVRIGLTYRIR